MIGTEAISVLLFLTDGKNRNLVVEILLCFKYITPKAVYPVTYFAAISIKTSQYFTYLTSLNLVRVLRAVLPTEMKH